MSSASASPFKAAAMKIETAGETTSMAMPMFFEEWREVDNGHYEYLLDDEAAPKAKVVLPAVTNGIINLSAVKQLQEKLDNAETKMKRMEEKAVEERVVLQLKMQASADDALQSRLNELREHRRFERVQIRNELRMEKSRDLSDEQVLDLLQHPVVMTKMHEKVRDSATEEKKKLEASYQDRVQEAKLQLSSEEMQEILESNWTARSIYREKVVKEVQEAKMHFSKTEMQELLANNETAREIFKYNLRKQLDIEKAKTDAQIQERIDTAKKQLSDTQIRELFISNLAAKAVLEEVLNKRLEEEKAKRDVMPATSSEGDLPSGAEASNTGGADAVIGKNERPFEAPAASAFGTPIKQEISFGVGVSRLTTPFRYAVAPLASSPKSTSPVVFGASSQPRSPLEVLSGAFSRPNVQQHSPLNPGMQAQNKSKIETEIQARSKRLRETEDVGGIEGGLKKIRKEEIME